MTQVYLLPIQGLHILSISKLVILDIFIGVLMIVLVLVLAKLLSIRSRSIELLSIISRSSKDSFGSQALDSLYISARSLFLSRYIIPVNSFNAEMTLVLLTYSNLLCQIYTFLIGLTKYVGLFHPLVIRLGELLTCMTLSGIVKSSMKKFWSFFLWAIDILLCIKSIDEELLWYVILLSQNYFNKMRFDLYYSIRVTLSSLIFNPLV